MKFVVFDWFLLFFFLNKPEYAFKANQKQALPLAPLSFGQDISSEYKLF